MQIETPAPAGNAEPARAATPDASLAALAAIAAASVTACGGGGGGATPQAGVPGGATLVAAGDAARFLAQAAPGASRADITALQQQGYSAWLDAQFALPRSMGHFDWLLAHGYAEETFRNNTQGLEPTIWRKLIASEDALRQ